MVPANGSRAGGAAAPGAPGLDFSQVSSPFSSLSSRALGPPDSHTRPLSPSSRSASMRERQETLRAEQAAEAARPAVHLAETGKPRDVVERQVQCVQVEGMAAVQHG